MRRALLSELDQLVAERRMRRGLRTILRAAWLAICFWCINLGANLLWSWPVRPALLIAISLALLAGGALLALRDRLSPLAAARRLDRRFRLEEQLATAVEVAMANPAPGSLPGRLVDQAAGTAERLHTYLRKSRRFPWSELVALLAMLLIGLGLYVMSGISSPTLSGDRLPLPGLEQPFDPLSQFGDEAPEQRGDMTIQIPELGQGKQEQGTPADREIIDALADALRDQGATRAAAEALDQGDLEQAAEELRELADQASRLSKEARDQLAEQLREAADRIQPRDPALAEQLREAGRGLEAGGQQAEQALEDLARALDDLAQGPQGPQEQGQGQRGDQGQGEGQGESEGQGDQGSGGTADQGTAQQRQRSASQRLGVDGQPLELETEGEGTIPAERDNQQPTSSRRSRGFTQGGAQNDQQVETGADPLRVPLDERNVVQDYFTP